MNTDRRRYPRIATREEIDLRSVDEPSRPFTATLTRDISEGGVRIINEKFIAKGKRLLTRFSMAAANDVISTVSQVAWVGQIPYSDRYQCGLEFIEITETHRQMLRDCISSRIKEKK